MSLTVEKCLEAWTNSLRQLNVKADIVFFGDSLTFYGDFSTCFPNNRVCNLGLRGDTLEGMIGRISQLSMLDPQYVFLMAGINDVSKNDLDEFKRHYETLIIRIKGINKKIKLVVQSMLPVNSKFFQISCSNAQIIDCNEIICNLAYSNHLQYIDLFSLYLRGGDLPKEMTIDGIHLNPSAYIEWYKEISKIIKDEYK